MAILLDTHALVWVGIGDPRLSEMARNAILDPDQQVLISAVTAYEFVDLNRRGRFGADLPFAEIATQLGAVIVDYPAACSVIAGLLPPLHLDPVDRMLIAFAIHSDLPIVTADATVRQYPVRVIW